MRVVAHVVKTQGMAGAENHLLKLLPALVMRGWDVHLVAVNDLSPATEAYEDALLQLLSLGVKSTRVTVAGKADPSGTLKIRRIVRALRPDLVHTHLPYADRSAPWPPERRESRACCHRGTTTTRCRQRKSSNIATITGSSTPCRMQSSPSPHASRSSARSKSG